MQKASPISIVAKSETSVGGVFVKAVGGPNKAVGLGLIGSRLGPNKLVSDGAAGWVRSGLQVGLIGAVVGWV